ncbi:MAG: hypothetical protein P8I56_09315, partial [Paracoccaceae bacterium]|nr:hypothetical protein [Paracoccaceae bacterium]
IHFVRSAFIMRSHIHPLSNAGKTVKPLNIINYLYSNVHHTLVLDFDGSDLFGISQFSPSNTGLSSPHICAAIC